MTRSVTTCPAASLCLSLLLAALAGCSESAPTATGANAAAAAMSSSDAITPDTSDSYCSLLPPEQVTDYKRVHDVFSSAPELLPQFEKGQLFADGATVSVKWPHADKQPLSITVDLLRRCSEASITGSPLYETAPGSGVFAAQISTSNAGSDYPSGSPGILRVITTTDIDMKTMTGKTTVLGEYTIRLQGPRG